MFMFEKICIKNIGVHHNLEKIEIGTTCFLKKPLHMIHHSFLSCLQHKSQDLSGCIMVSRGKHHNDFHLHQMMPENVKLVQPFFGWDG